VKEALKLNNFFKEMSDQQDEQNSKVITWHRMQFARVNRYKPLLFQTNKQAEA